MGIIKLPIKNDFLEVEIKQKVYDKIKKNKSMLENKGIAKIRCTKIEITKFPKVSDVCRYKIKKCGNNISVTPFKTSDYSSKKFKDKKVSKYQKKPVILLILESPHKDEYDDNFNPIVPANGKTGNNIEKSLVDVLTLIENKNCFLKNGVTYYLIISNPVPYQTSLYYFHNKAIKDEYKTLRNKIWKEIWDFKDSNNKLIIQDDFGNRIETYNPDLIINACTADLSKSITEFMKDNFDDRQLIKTYHPSGWNGFGIEIL